MDTSFYTAFTTVDGEERQGPLQLLWYLIQSYKVDIFKIPLSRITDDFLDYMQKHKATLEQKSSFLEIGTRLLYYKSVLLLPKVESPQMDDIFAHSDVLPQALISRLLEHKRLQNASNELGKLQDDMQYHFTRESQWHFFEEGINLLEVDLTSLLKTYQELLKKIIPTKWQFEKETVTVEQMIEALKEELQISTQCSFEQFTQFHKPYAQVITFLAVLDLVLRKHIQAKQQQWQGDITLQAL